jgi:drug/metabolite transporter (DMT)-like permease
MKKNLPLVYLCLILAMVFWGFSFVGTKICLELISPITLIFSRLIVSVTFLFILTKSLGILQPIKKNDLKWFFLLSFFEPLLYFLGETFGLQLVSSTLGAVLIATIPLFVPWVAWIIFREKMYLLNLIGIIISIVGVIFCSIDKDFSFHVSLLGIALLFVAVFSAVGYSMVLRHIAHEYSPITIVTWQNFFGLLAFFPLFIIFDFPSIQFSQLTSTVIYNILILGIFPSSLSYMFFAYSVREIGINRSSIFSNLIPVLTAVFAFFIMDESLPFLKIIGILIVIFALTISQMKNNSFLKYRKNNVS